MKWLIALMTVLSSYISLADVKVAFVVMRDRSGNVLQMEPGGQFAHVAISYQGQWIHAHPYRGVEIISSSDLQQFGHVTFINVPNVNEVSSTELERYIGKPYDKHYAWGDESYYCSSLVGKILNIEPLPMSFQADLWKGKLRTSNSKGLSPDDIYQIILNERVRIMPGPHQCRTLFRTLSYRISESWPN